LSEYRSPHLLFNPYGLLTQLGGIIIMTLNEIVIDRAERSKKLGSTHLCSLELFEQSS